ncbi:MAG TPA: VWA domain-containing protein [Bryobacteraceae bacterium]|nr:VWA domain-containing protein [Bryobacteraceae bacterium]
MTPEMKMPGGDKFAGRPLHFIWILDCSGSMKANGKIQALNTAIREAIPALQQAARDNPEAQVLVRALRFSRGAQWHIAVPTPVDELKWEDVTADAHTDMGKALAMVAEEMKVPPMKPRSLPPVLVLISDGQPTDDFSVGLKKLMDQPWGRAAVRLAIAIGQDADLDVLQRFIGMSPEERAPLQADNAEMLVENIRWASTVGVSGGSKLGPQPLPPTKPAAPVNDPGDLW